MPWRAPAVRRVEGGIAAHSNNLYEPRCRNTRQGCGCCNLCCNLFNCRGCRGRRARHMSADAMNSPPSPAGTPDGCRVLALAAVTYQDIPRSRHGERPMGRKPLTPAQRERRRASQKRWEEKSIGTRPPGRCDRANFARIRCHDRRPDRVDAAMVCQAGLHQAERSGK